jgi:hypothetical protein
MGECARPGAHARFPAPTLYAEAYAAVVAFLLERNGVEAGEVPFDPSDDRVAALDLTFGD